MHKLYQQLGTILLGLFIICLLIFFHYFQIYQIKGRSMEPTLQSGQYILARKTNQNISSGDIVIIEIDNKRIVKRVIALPSEGIFYQKKQIVLKDEEYYVLGDNQDHSIDSRALGPIKKEQIKGIVLLRENR